MACGRHELAPGRSPSADRGCSLPSRPLWSPGSALSWGSFSLLSLCGGHPPTHGENRHQKVSELRLWPQSARCIYTCLVFLASCPSGGGAHPCPGSDPIPSHFIRDFFLSLTFTCHPPPIFSHEHVNPLKAHQPKTKHKTQRPSGSPSLWVTSPLRSPARAQLLGRAG